MSARKSKAPPRSRKSQAPIEPVRGLGLTWVEHGFRYRLRRMLLSALYFLVLLLMAVMSATFTSGLIGASGSSEPTHIGIIGAVSCVITGSAFWSWRSTVRREQRLNKSATAENRRWSTGLAVTTGAVSRTLVKTVVGALAIVLCVFVGTGIAFTGFALSLRKEYFGETKARRRLEEWRRKAS